MRSSVHVRLPSSAAASLYQQGARCFVATLRDPSARLVTTFKFENAVRWPPTGSFRLSSSAPGSKHDIGPNDWMQRFRGFAAPTPRIGQPIRGEPPGQPAAQHLPGPSPPTQVGARHRTRHGGGLALPRTPVVVASYLADFSPRRVSSSHASRSVAGYGAGARGASAHGASASGVGDTVELRVNMSDAAGRNNGLSATPVVYVVCANRYERDWQQFLQAHVPPPSSGSSNFSTHAWAVPQINRRGNPLQYSLTLSPENVDYIRECMYPYDWALYRRLCLDEANATVAAPMRRKPPASCSNRSPFVSRRHSRGTSRGSRAARPPAAARPRRRAAGGATRVLPSRVLPLIETVAPKSWQSNAYKPKCPFRYHSDSLSSGRRLGKFERANRHNKIPKRRRPARARILGPGLRRAGAACGSAAPPTRT